LRLAKWGSGVSLHGSNPEAPMSALGQKQTLANVRVMSALPPKADVNHRERHVRFVPKTDIERSLYQLVGDLLDMDRHFKTERLGSLKINQQLEFCRQIR
jgi:hypothetical protein